VKLCGFFLQCVRFDPRRVLLWYYLTLAADPCARGFSRGVEGVVGEVDNVDTFGLFYYVGRRIEIIEKETRPKRHTLPTFPTTGTTLLKPRPLV